MTDEALIPNPPTSAPDVARVLKARAITIALANVPLAAVIYTLGMSAMGDGFRRHAGAFIAIEVGVLVAGLFAYSENAFNAVLESLQMQDDAGRPRRLVSPLRIKSIFLAYVIAMIVANFAALGIAIQASGGFVESPFVQLAATLLIMGAVMAAELLSQIVIFLFGVLYFTLLAYSNVFGAVEPLHVEHLLPGTVFLVVTLANLVLGLIITKRTRRANNLTETGGNVAGPMQENT